MRQGDELRQLVSAECTVIGPVGKGAARNQPLLHVRVIGEPPFEAASGDPFGDGFGIQPRARLVRRIPRPRLGSRSIGRQRRNLSYDVVGLRLREATMHGRNLNGLRRKGK